MGASSATALPLVKRAPTSTAPDEPFGSSRGLLGSSSLRKRGESTDVAASAIRNMGKGDAGVPALLVASMG